MRRGSIRLPAEIDSEAKRQDGVDRMDSSTMKKMRDTKQRSDQSLTRLSMMLARTSDLDQDIDNESQSSSGSVVRRNGSKLRKHTSVPDFAVARQTLRAGSKETVKSTASRRSSFRPEDMEQARHFANQAKSSNQAGELSTWLNAEMITRRADESQTERLTLRQLMKVDDRINPLEFSGKKYGKSKPSDDEDHICDDELPPLMPNARTKLRHSVSYRMKTIE